MIAVATSEEATTRVTLAERLDTLPLSSFHWRLVLLSGLGWMFDAMDVGLISGMLPVLVKAWGLSSVQNGILSSAALVGMLVGAAVAGTLADRYGRRPLFIAMLGVFTVFTGVCGLAWNFSALLVLRFLVGLGLGGELPIAASYMSEFAPRRHRGRLVCFIDTFWSLGWTLAATMTFLLLGSWGWRVLFLAGAVPVLFVIPLRLGMPESPRFLLARGRREDAIAVVREVEASCHVAPAALEVPTATPASEPATLGDLWRPGLARQTFMLWVLWFTLGYSYFGIYFWLPSLLVSSGHTLYKSLGYTVLISLAQAPGFLSAAFLVDRYGRRPTLVVYRTMLALGCFLFAWQADSALHIILWGSLISFFGMGSWGIVYTYTTEIYATHLRTTGAGWATSLTRLGGIVAPPVIGWMMTFAGGQTVVFVHMAAIIMVGVLVVVWLGRETQGQGLEAISA